MSVDLELLQEVEALSNRLDDLDYFQILRVSPDADRGMIREGYHRQARRYHPDRYHHLSLPQLARDLTRISKRITEAYVTLRDADQRARYLKGITGPERQQRLRYREMDEQALRAEREAETGRTPQVRQFYHGARLAHANNDLGGAIKSLRMALTYEPDNEHFQQLLAEWAAAAKES